MAELQTGSMADQVLQFIRSYVATHDTWPPHAKICAACDILPWQIGNVLDRLRTAGHIDRERLSSERGAGRMLYRYWLVTPATSKARADA